MTFPRIFLPCAGFPGPSAVSGPQLGAGQSGDPAPFFLPLLGGASTRDAADQRRAQAERLDRRMRHLDAVPQWCSEGEMPTATATTEGPYMRPASNHTARPAVLHRTDRKQCASPFVSSAHGRREEADGGLEGHRRDLHCRVSENRQQSRVGAGHHKCGASCHVGRKARHSLTFCVHHPRADYRCSSGVERRSLKPRVGGSSPSTGAKTARPAVLPRLDGVTGGAPGRKLAPQPTQRRQG